MGCTDSHETDASPEEAASEEDRFGDKELAWHIFAHLDLKDEAERLELAQFLHTLMEYTPEGERRAADEAEVFAEAEPPTEGKGYETATDTESSQQAQVGSPDDETSRRKSFLGSVSRRLSLGSIGFKRSTRDMDPAEGHDAPPAPEEVMSPVASQAPGAEVPQASQHWDIRQAEIDEDTIDDLLKLCEKGGRLSRASFQRLLRESYEAFKEQPNVQHCTIDDPAERITVVGDLHGSLRDLRQILRTAGMPSLQHKMIFNGDFVDRGSEGCEVLGLILALQLAFPDEVALNRGNHEDEALTRVYGFEAEVKDKYDKRIFEMCALLFKYLPLCTTINGVVLVLHGGLFHRDDVRMADVERIPRADYGPLPPEAQGQSNPGWYRTLPEEEQEPFMLNALCQEILWSDPMAERGQKKSPRGAGMLFGPDICYRWLAQNGFDLLVRSHEAVPKGFALPYKQMKDLPHGQHCCATIFSASDYCGIGNKGATLSFRVKAAGDDLADSQEQVRGFEMYPVGAETLAGASMYYIVYDYYTSKDKPDLGAYNGRNLATRILHKKPALKRRLKACEDPEDGTVSVPEFAQVMTDVLDLELHWPQVLPLIAPEGSVTERTGEGTASLEKRVHVRRFLNRFASAATEKAESGEGDNDDLLAALYAHRSRLEAVFHFFDTDGSGEISREEFRRGCEVVNNRIPEGEPHLGSAERILQLMDFDADGSLDMNEFFEVFRLAELPRNSTPKGSVEPATAP